MFALGGKIRVGMIKPLNSNQMVHAYTDTQRIITDNTAGNFKGFLFEEPCHQVNTNLIALHNPNTDDVICNLNHTPDLSLDSLSVWFSYLETNGSFINKVYVLLQIFVLA